MRYDLLSPRKKKDGSTHWHKVGAGFPRDNGGFSLSFDSLPLPDAEGKVFLMMAEPRDNTKGRPEKNTAQARPRGPDGFEDEDVGF